jgi:hypothetical protein
MVCRGDRKQWRGIASLNQVQNSDEERHESKAASPIEIHSWI